VAAVLASLALEPFKLKRMILNHFLLGQPPVSHDRFIGYTSGLKITK